MGVRIERRVVVEDRADETRLNVEWDDTAEPPAFLLTMENGARTVELYANREDIGAFIGALQNAYGEHDPF